ncbi:FKBP-type peptidylprolyl isomerase (plasmid) [Pedobacter sp. BS3]|uniref:FKBP-type peptidyl-prolyl cis-trans isomerase n=1 Tax=Pedobacter sp. BS3 TaxID=2567937 RepID=UPI0011EBE44A|nr:FKBP-type peptidyl-prolyl cis-trans isomerase [Pedobacter sp. BS3]TZF85976.1 FKBP-type peptidylprolyl isomerase [Pedobacter sp. BS3]
MKKNLIVLGFATLALASCQQFKKGEGDMLYKINTDKEGPTIKEGDFVAFKAIEKTEGDSVLYSSYDYDRPSLLLEEKSVFKGDLYAALKLLSEGDSATFKINMDSMEKKMGRPKPQNAKGKYLVYNIKIDKVLPKGNMNDSIFHSKIDEYLKAEAETAKNQEAGKLDAYVKNKDLKPTVTASGLKYVVTKQGSGEKAAAGDTVEVNYTGSFLTGKVFDTSIEEVAKKSGNFNQMRPYKPIKIPVGAGGSIPGFDEGLMLFPKGTKATLILPSKLAYGQQGNQAIPPYTPLIFDIEIVNIIHPTAQAPVAAAPAAPAPAK